MSLIEKLERAARDRDVAVARSLHNNSYDQRSADMRELLLKVAQKIKQDADYIVGLEAMHIMNTRLLRRYAEQHDA